MFSSTLSLAFFICVLSAIAMVFMNIEPNQVTFGVLTAVISAYLARYWTPKPDDSKKDTTTITTSTTTPNDDLIHNQD